MYNLRKNGQSIILRLEEMRKELYVRFPVKYRFIYSKIPSVFFLVLIVGFLLQFY